MNNLVVIGSSTPLQKVLPAMVKRKKINVSAVFLDEEKDNASNRFCNKAGIPVYSANQLKFQKGVGLLNHYKPQWLLSINSTLILSDEILKIPKNGAFNFHPGILPDYAGLHVHQWAIRNGEKEFGVTLHWMNSGIDTGNIAYQTRFALKGNETGLSLYLKCLDEGVKITGNLLDDITAGKEIPKITQNLHNRKLYTHKMAMEGKINWEQKSEEILNFIRAADYSPFKCPTYQPYTIFKGDQWIISKATEHHDRMDPGIAKLNRNGALLIGTGNGSIFVKTMKNKEGKKVEDKEMKELFECNEVILMD